MLTWMYFLSFTKLFCGLVNRDVHCLINSIAPYTTKIGRFKTSFSMGAVYEIKYRFIARKALIDEGKGNGGGICQMVSFSWLSSIQDANFLFNLMIFRFIL